MLLSTTRVTFLSAATRRREYGSTRAMIRHRRRRRFKTVPDLRGLIQGNAFHFELLEPAASGRGYSRELRSCVGTAFLLSPVPKCRLGWLPFLLLLFIVGIIIVVVLS